MKLKLLRISYFTILLAFTGLLIFSEIDFPKKSTPKKAKANPSFIDFYLLKKKNESGIIPGGLSRTWEKQTLIPNKTGDVLMDSVTELGPFTVGGRTRSIVIDHKNPQIMWLAAISGGVWKTNDGGASWFPINDQAPNLNVSYIEQNPFNENILYYCTGEGAGNSSGAPGDGIYKSTDRGQTFERLAASEIPAFDYGWKIISSPLDSHTFWVATGYAGLWKSEDAGASFKQVYVSNRPIYDIEIFSDGKILMGVNQLGLFMSNNGDSGTFTQVTAGLPISSTGRYEIAISPTNPSKVYLAIANNTNTALVGFYSSVDSGQTFVEKRNPSLDGGSYPFTWYCLIIGVRANNDDHVFIGSVNPMVSFDGGDNWIRAENSHADYHVYINDPQDPNSFYSGNDGGIYKYSWNSVDEFTSLNNGLSNIQFYTGTVGASGYFYMGGTQDNGTWYGMNNQDDYKKVFGGDGAGCKISKQDPSTAYVSSQNGNILRTRNLNQQFFNVVGIKNDLDANSDGEIDEGAWFINPLEINPFNGNEIYFPTKRKLWRSFDGGDNWEPVTNNIGSAVSTREPFCVSVTNEFSPCAYVGGSNGLLFYIDDVNGQSPGSEKNLRTRLPSVLFSSFINHIKIHPEKRSTIFVSFTNYSTTTRLWMANNANTDTPEWLEIGKNLPRNLPVNWMDLDPENPDSIWFAGTDFGLYYTTNAGETWLKETRIPNTVISTLEFRESDRKLFVFTHGRGIYSIKINSISSTPQNISTNGVKTKDLLVYPNPSKDYFYLDLPLIQSKPESFTLKIYSAEGKEQKALVEFVDSKKLKIEHSFKPGVYIIDLKINQSQYQAKLLVP